MADQPVSVVRTTQPENKGQVAKISETTLPSVNPVVVRPSKDVLEAARLKAAKNDDPDTVYEVNVSQWGHDDDRFVRGQLVMREDIPEGYDFKHARLTETLVASTISAADYRKMKKEATQKALDEEGLK